MNTLVVKHLDSEILHKFLLDEVDHVSTHKWFDVEAYVQRAEPDILCHTDGFVKTPKSGRILEVYTKDPRGNFHMSFFNADYVVMYFE